MFLHLTVERLILDLMGPASVRASSGVLQQTSINLGLLHHVYNNTVSSSGLRRLLVNWFGWSIELSYFQRPHNQEWLKLHGEIAVDLGMCWIARLQPTSKSPFEASGGGPQQFFDKS